MKIKPFLRWAGGKQKLVDELLSNAPNDDKINKYYEPFLGAGSLFFSNGFTNAVISDINPQLINSYVQIKTDYLKVSKLVSRYVRLFKKDPSYYYKVRELYNMQIRSENYIQAARFIFLIHSNYNGMYRINKRGNYNVPIGKLIPSIPTGEHLELISKKLQNISIICSNYRDVLTEVKPNDFIYFDPPYPPLEWTNHQNQYTINHFTKEDHENLYNFACELKNIGCFILISYPDTEFIRDIYSEWNITQLDTFRSISCKKERKKISELIIKNY